MPSWADGCRGRKVASSRRRWTCTASADTSKRRWLRSLKKAGLTERTFFRYFADKREVLFFGWKSFVQTMVDAVEQAPADAAPIDAIRAALESVAQFFTDNRSQASRRQGIIAANPVLQEREHNKLATLAAAMASALEQRGVKDSTAALAAEMGVAVFKISFERWLRDEKNRDCLHFVRQSLDEMKMVSAGR